MPRLSLLIATLLALTIAVVAGGGAVFGQIEDALSPASGHASVVAQGVAAMPAGDLAWRVSRATDPAPVDRPARAGPGFILVDEGVLVLSDLASGAQARLAGDEAIYVGAGARHQESPASASPPSYYRIDLVPAAEVTIADGDELPFVGQPFVSPGGSHDVDLVRDVLAADETVELDLDARAAPVLLMVTAGAVELVPADNPAAAPVRLPEGQGAGLGGDVMVRAADGAGATFVTATIGPEVPPLLAQEVAPAFASLTVQARSCPVAYAGTQYATDCVEPRAEIAYSLESAELGVLLDAATGPDGAAAFSDLAPGTYALTGGAPGELATQIIQCADLEDAVANEASQTQGAGALVTLAEGQHATCWWYMTPEELQGAAGATIAVSAHLCPGTPIDPYADCATGDAAGVLIDGPVRLSTDAASGLTGRSDGVSWIWGEEGELPFGTYVLQPEGIAIPAGYEISEVRGAVGDAGTGWTFVVDETNPNPLLMVLYVPAGEAQTQPAGGGDGDGDGLTDAHEAELGSDPANPDSDADGLFDGPELAIGTNPVLYDTDGDGFGDNQEAVSRANPNDPASVPEVGEPAIDTDGDMLTDAEEAELGTNAAATDSDGDGLPDFAEVGFEPGSSTGSDPTRFDSDGDGVGDGQEVANGTDPTDAASV